ncbi:MAG: DUF4845 domain-containing protein [Polaromonas sp.]|nr:DUF4845 domain-containing protein [Polaromonas sp.]
MKHHQRGLSLIGLLFFGVLAGSTFLVAAKAVPTYIEYQAITKAVNKAKDGATVAEIRSTFDKAAQIDDISTISGKDLIVTKDGGKTVVAFAYSREIPLAGPAFLLLKYDGRSN